MTAPKLILFNGPRHSGKDTAALHCVRTYGAHHFKMSQPLKGGIKAIFDLSDEQVEWLESIKTDPSAALFGKSYVDLQISLSEDWLKQLYGDSIFGRLAADKLIVARAENPDQELYVCSDSGFASEAWPVIKLFGPENTLLVRITRPGKTFTGDSRSYIELDGITAIALNNDGDEGKYKRSVEQVVEHWLYGIRYDEQVGS